MNAPSRFDALEKQLIDGLRQAPGPEPSADLDARIRARAHAALRPAKRQTRWFSMAAGLVVLVGSGLALQIARQVDQAPSALDAPAIVVPSEAPVAIETPTSGARAESASAANIAAVSEDAASAKPEAILLQRQPQAKLAAPGLIDAPADDRGGALADSMPFPAQPAPEASAKAERAFARQMPIPPPPTAPALAAQSAPVAAASPAPEPEPAFDAPSPPAALALAPIQEAAAAAQAGSDPLAQRQSSEGKTAAAGASGAAPQRLRDAAPSQPKVATDKGDSERHQSPHSEASIDPYNVAIEGIRAALADGDSLRAREQLAKLRQAFPDQVLPEDLRAWADRPQ